MNVLYGCDDRYAPYTGVSITSLFANNLDAEEITVYLAGDNISPQNLEKLNRTVARYGRQLVLLDTEKAARRIAALDCGSWNGSLATWLRFFVLEQIPDTVDRLLWLDSDTLVCQSLKELFAADFDGCPLGCVCDSICYYERYRLGFEDSTPYFNAGVILFDMKRWRAEGLADAMLATLPANVGRYKLNDQDLLNDFFVGKIKKFPPQFNLQGFVMAYPEKDYFEVYPWEPQAYYTPQQMADAKLNPTVIHFFRFLGDYPWQAGNNLHPARHLYEQAKAASEWKDYASVPAGGSIAFGIEKILYMLLPAAIFLRIFSAVTNQTYRAKAERKKKE